MPAAYFGLRGQTSAIDRRRLNRIGILRTLTAIKIRLYGSISNAQIIVPRCQGLSDVQRAYVEMAVSGVVTKAQRPVFISAMSKLFDEDRVEAILPGGAGGALVVNKGIAGFPLIDCAGIHADAVARLALAQGGAGPSIAKTGYCSFPARSGAIYIRDRLLRS